ncbi:MAG: alpha-galactosidase [Bacteroidales bacterium]|nr:alpha-galactosidase [Bacteroidales bacterium]
MKKIILFAVVAVFSFLPLTGRAQFVLDTDNSSFVLKAEKGQAPLFLYYGALLDKGDLQAVLSGGHSHSAYPTRLTDTSAPEALSVEMPDGNMTAKLCVESVSEGSWEGGKELTINCSDPLYPNFSVALHYRSYSSENMIETWTEIRNGGRKPMTLHRFDSGFLPISEGNVWMTSLHGGWAAEAELVSEPLRKGTREISAHTGVKNSDIAHSEVLFSLDGEPCENSGRVIGAALCYAGNFELRVITRDDGVHRFFAGISPRDSWYTLAKGETFTTPKLALTWSDEGLVGASRNFHRWGRKYRLHGGGVPGDILLNSWEGVYFDINEAEMHKMARDIASIGGELFVIDDGWFGSEKYPRDHDRQGLGDWTLLKNKLPHGLQGMVDECRKEGIKFGIWVEPEMANTTSVLYETHPDWIINDNGREVITGRGGTQVVLDLCNPAVQDYVFGIIDGVMKQAPGISYIKWDCNNHMRSPGSPYLKNQNHLYIEYMRGLEKVLERVRAAYPDITIQLCSSGGARVNWGLLPWFDEFWTSDNTDALQRLRIQWSTSLFFPAEAMACHVSASPNHQTGRIIPLKYRIDVAMSGRLGFELQPSTLSEEERELCRNAVSDYKKIRQTVQCGDLYRLVSPFDDKGLSSLLYASEDKSQAVFFWWRTVYYRGQHAGNVLLKGIDPERHYKITELNKAPGEPVSELDGKTVSGRYLISNGFFFPEKNSYHGSNDWHSHVILLEAE